MDPSPAAYVTANGERIEIHPPITLHQFLLQIHCLPKSVVVEHNGQAVAPSEFSHRPLSHQDRLEIVTIVAGG